MVKGSMIFAQWGFLYSEKTEEADIAPVYDCGSCLLPQADEKIVEAVLTDKKELYARIYQFPTSAIKENGRKINYYDFLMKAEFKECNAALKRIVPRVDMKQIISMIEQIPCISDRQKEFYKQYIQTRFDLILRPAVLAL